MLHLPSNIWWYHLTAQHRLQTDVLFVLSQTLVVAQSKSKQTFMTFVVPQMAKFMAITKGRINLCCCVVADIYLFEGGKP